MLKLRPFNFSEEDYEQMASVRQAAYADNGMSAKDFKRIDDYTPQDEYDWARMMAEWNGRVVGYGLYTKALWLKEPNLYVVGWLTHPDFRGRGIASAYWNHIEKDVLPVREISALLLDVRGDVPGAASFVENRGFRRTLTTTESRLDLTRFDTTPYEPTISSITGRGIQLTPLSELIANDPDHLQKLVQLEQVLREDEPTAQDQAPISPEMFQNYYMSSDTFYPDGWYIAVDNGRYVGWCAVLPNPQDAKTVRNGITVVERDYRRIGLATAMKVHVIKHALRMGAETIMTSNISTNPILLLNQALGFEPVYESYEYKKLMF